MSKFRVGQPKWENEGPESAREQIQSHQLAEVGCTKVIETRFVGLLSLLFTRFCVNFPAAPGDLGQFTAVPQLASVPRHVAVDLREES